MRNSDQAEKLRSAIERIAAERGTRACAVALHERGVLDKYRVELIGADIDAIQRGEDRQKFKDIVRKIGAEVPRSKVCTTMDEVRETVAVHLNAYVL